MGGKAVAEHMRRRRLCDARLAHRNLHRPLQECLVDMVTANRAGAWIGRHIGSGKDVLPSIRD
jgi:hypothetical protein